jgi:hypothetical protein
VSLEEVAVERLEKLGGGAVVHLADTHHQPRRPSMEEGLGEADQPLAADLLAEPRLAAGEDDEIGRKSELLSRWS